MQSMVLEEFGAPLVLRDREIPVPDEGEVVLKVRACGVCQTDLKICHGKHPGARKVPLIPGHEVAGEIVQVGTGVDKIRIGKYICNTILHIIHVYRGVIIYSCPEKLDKTRL